MFDDSFFLNVGIDAVGFYAPKNRLSLDDLARKRGIDPNKYRHGLLAEEFAVPDYGEDAVTMAVMAAKNALVRSQVDPREIQAIFVGSESIPYAVKSISSILCAFLNVNEYSLTGDTLHACAGATIGMLNAIGLVHAGIIDKAMVIGTDISKYPIGSPGEPTQGAGAAAMIISKDPRIARIGKKFGKVSGHVNDFFRTHFSETAEVFGQYSTTAYMNYVLKAYDDFKAQAGQFLADYYVFHAPFGKMPVKSFQRIMFERWIDTPEKLPVMLGKQVNVTEQQRAMVLEGREELHQNTVQILREKGFNEEDIIRLNYFYKEWLALKLMPCLDVPMRFGNCYSASLWAQLIHLIETRVKEGEEIYFTSYGSGATAISGVFKMQPGFKEQVSRGPTVLDYIRKKQRIPVEYYEMYRKDLLPGTLHVGHVLPTPDNRHFLRVNTCDYGCVLPFQDEIRYCPKGHPGVHPRKFPLSGIANNVHVADLDVQRHKCIDSVYLLGDITDGAPVELSVRRLQVDVDPDLDGYGLIHWYPCYVPA